MRDLGNIIGINSQVTRKDVAVGLRQGTLSRQVAASILSELPRGERSDEKELRREEWYRSKAANRREQLKKSFEQGEVEG